MALLFSAVTVTANEDKIVVCAPMMTRDSKSLPYWSVPSR